MHGGTERDREEGLVTASSRWVPVGVSLLSALLVVGPGLGPGYLLVRDMVFVPRPPLTGRLLGLWHEAPRAVPSDLVVALASQVLAGDLVQKVVLIGILVGAGVGAARLAPARALPASAAALAAVWNPYVAERLAMGHWALLVGYASLPWVLRGTSRTVTGRVADPTLAVGLVVGSLGGAASWLVVVIGLLGAAAGNAVAGRAPGLVSRRLLPWAALALVLALPWAVPGLLRPGATVSDTSGFEVFRPRADTPAGLVVSLLTGGGTWNADVVPAGRDTALGLAGASVLLLWALAGYVLTRGHRAEEVDLLASRHRVAIAGAGILGLAMALLSSAATAVAPLAALPGGGLLRDGARELAPWVLLVAVGCGWAVAWLLARGANRVLAGLTALLPLAVLPSLGWGLSGSLQPVDYPSGVTAIARIIEEQPGRGAVVVLPFEAYRTYPWNADRPSLTPWSRLNRARTVVSSDLVVTGPSGSTTVGGEDGYAAAVRSALGSPDPVRELRALGVGWLVTDARATAVPEGAVPVSQAPDASLYRLDPPVAVGAAEAFDPPTVAVLLADGLWLLVLLAVLVRPATQAVLARRASAIG
jgi:hypothetical protein